MRLRRQVGESGWVTHLTLVEKPSFRTCERNPIDLRASRSIVNTLMSGVAYSSSQVRKGGLLPRK